MGQPQQHSEQMLYLEALNENGTIHWRDSKAEVLEFRYTNQFCGSCCFLGRVTETPERGVGFAEEDLIWEDFSLKRGNSQALYKNAVVFFEQYLRRQTSVDKFHRQVSTSSGHGLRHLIRRLLGKDALSPSKCIQENGAGTFGVTRQSECLTDREEGGHSNGNGAVEEELPILELDLKKPVGKVPFDLDLPSKGGRQKPRTSHTQGENSTQDRQPDRNGDRRTPLLPFCD